MPLSKGDIASIIILCGTFSLIFGLWVYTRDLDPQQHVSTFTVSDSKRFCLGWVNCTTVTFIDGNGLTFNGYHQFDIGKTYTVIYLRHRTLEGSKILNIQEIK